MKNLKDEKGSITLYVILSFMFFLMITIGTFISVKNKEIQQEQEIARIQDNYNEVELDMEYTVSFNANGGNVDITSKNLKYGKEYGELPTPTREGYTFKGWSGNNLLNLHDRTEVNWGEAPNTSVRNFTGKSIIKGLTSSNYYYKNNVSSYEIDDINNNVIVHDSTGWQANGYGVGFDVRVEPNTNYTLSHSSTSETVCRVGMYKETGEFIATYVSTGVNDYVTFNTGQYGCWITVVVATANTSQIGTTYGEYNIKLEKGNRSTEYEPYYITSDTLMNQKGNHTLTAIWEQNTTVTFNANGGNVDINSKEVVFGESYGTLPTPTREGYTFKGWSGNNLLNLHDRTEVNWGEASNTSVRNFTGKSIIKGLTSSNYYYKNNVSSYEIDDINNNVIVHDSTGWQAIGYGVGFDVRVEPNTNYTLSHSSTSETVCRVGIYKETGEFIATYGSAGVNDYMIFNTGQYGCWITVVVATANTSQIGTTYGEYNIKLEKSSYSTPYEPYYITSNTEVNKKENHTLTAIWEKSKLMQWASDANTDFHKESIRNSITEIEFVDLKNKTAPSELNENSCWDVSQGQEKTVLAWLEGTKLYIGGEGGVTANEDSSYLFNEFTNVTKITFGDNFDTSNTQNMEYMFYKCHKLATIDVNHINTGNVTSMKRMFGVCNKIKKFDLSSWDTSKVKDFGDMFNSWDSSTSTNTDMDLEEIIIGENFDTSNATSMSNMFAGLNNLIELDLSNFNTSNVTSMFHMFYCCTNLKTIYVSDKFVTDAVTDSNSMFVNCSKLVGGKGTTYSYSYIDKTYARIDKVGQPGYFTEMVDYSNIEIGASINYTAPSGMKNASDGNITWEILYGNNKGDLYIIAREKCKSPDNTLNLGTESAVLTKNNGGAYSGTTLESSQAVTKGLMSEMVTYLSNPDNATNNELSTSQKNIQATNYMLDNDKWSGYIDTTQGADWAIGGPTLELLCMAYNKKNNYIQGNDNYKWPTVSNSSGVGYDAANLGTEGSLGNASNSNVFLHNSGVFCWLACPSINDSINMRDIYATKRNISGIEYYRSISNYGFRPVVHLTGVHLEENGTNGYTIQQN